MVKNNKKKSHKEMELKKEMKLKKKEILTELAF